MPAPTTSARPSAPVLGSPGAVDRPVLRLSGVTRRHAGRPVWAPLDLVLDAGTVTVVTGPNGSGKTTLLRLAAGLLQPSTGSRDCAGPALYLRSGGGLRSAQTLGDAVRSAAALAGRGAAAPQAVERLGLRALAGRRVGTLSAGERMRGCLALAVAVAPALLCLDEPTAALDERGLADLRDAVDRLRLAGTATLVASHQPDAVLPVADAHLRLHQGGVRRA